MTSPSSGPRLSGPSPVKDADLVARETAASMRAACDLLRGPPRSSRDDPDFMNSFFKSSRLHFIGTWKSRIETLMATTTDKGPAPKSVLGGGRAGVFFPGTAGGGRLGPAERVIVHIDMDCFFASAATVGHPELKDRPLAVCHSNSSRGTGEVSSANYEARRFGIRAGMFISEAKKRCPSLIVVPYEFDKYESISEKVYRILLRYTCCVQPLSCDEAYLDITGLGEPAEMVTAIRRDIEGETQCTASAGVGPNMLVARLATRKAKPNGQIRVKAAAAKEFLEELPVDDLPGVGWSLKTKLTEMGITSIRQVWSSSKEVLIRRLGKQTGLNLWNYAHGLDDRPVEPPKARKSVGAEVNWGIRFTCEADAEKFLDELCQEVSNRLKAAGVKGKAITLKVKRRQAGAPEPVKFLGCGACDSLSRSTTVGHFTDNPQELFRESQRMYQGLGVPAEEVRGLGVSVSKLDNDGSSATARPSAPAPAKLLAPKPTSFEAGPWISGPLGPLYRVLVSGGADGSPEPGGQAVQANTSTSKSTPVNAAVGPVAYPTASLGDAAEPAVNHDGAITIPDDDEEEEVSMVDPGVLQAPEELGHTMALGDLDQDLLQEMLDYMPAEAARTLLRDRSGGGRDHLLPECGPGPGPTGTRQTASGGGVLPRGGRSLQDAPATKGALSRLGAPPPSMQATLVSGVSALPPPSELDPEVVDALPLDMKRELERAYGVKLMRGRSPEGSKKRGRAHSPDGTVGSRNSGAMVGLGRQTKRVGKKPRRGVAPTNSGGRLGEHPWVRLGLTLNQKGGQVDRGVFVIRPGQEASTGPLGSTGLRGHLEELPGDIDPEVLNALPEDIQKEVMGRLPASVMAGRGVDCHSGPGIRGPHSVLDRALLDHGSRWGESGMGSGLVEVPHVPEPHPEPEPVNAVLAELEDTLGKLTASGQDINNKLKLVYDVVLPWLKSLDKNLEELRRGLLGLQSIAIRFREFGALSEVCIAEVQEHVRERYGFVIALRRVMGN